MNINKGNTVILKNGQAMKVDGVNMGKEANDDDTIDVSPLAGDSRVGHDKYVFRKDVLGVVEFTQHADPAVQMILDEMPKVENRYAVVRPESNVAAIVSFKAASLMTTLQALVALKESVTRWVMQTFEGTKAWDESAEDFNIGDLIGHLNDARLRVFLKTFGIHDMQIESLNLSGHSGDWNYDTLLVTDSEELKSRLKRSEDRIPATQLTDPDAETEEEIENLSWDSGRKDGDASQQ